MEGAAPMSRGSRRVRSALGSVAALGGAVATLGTTFAGPDPGRPATKVLEQAPEAVGDLPPQGQVLQGAAQRSGWFDDNLNGVANAWSGVARKAAASRPTGPATAVAWRRTLRLVAIGLGLPVIRGRKGKYSRKKRQEQRPAPLDGELGEDDALTVRRALQRFDLPFFATDGERATFPLKGVKISGNLRSAAGPEEAAWTPEAADVVKGAIEEALGRKVIVHLLRVEDDSQSEVPCFELLVRKDTARAEAEPDLNSIGLAVASFAVVFACTQGLGEVALFQALGAVLAPGAVAPAALLCALPLAGEAVRFALAKSQGVQIGLPLFLPSPQLGVFGAYADPEVAPNRSSALALSLAAPLTVAALSGLLLWYSSGLAAAAGGSVVLASTAQYAWPLAMLPSQCDNFLYAGTQGLLMAAYALMPHSPDGKTAWSCIIGNKRAERLREISSYLHPFIGLLANWFCGQGWATLPLFYAFLLVNFATQPRLPPLEELSEVPLVARIAALLALLAAVVFVFPGPVPGLLAVMQAIASPGDTYSYF